MTEKKGLLGKIMDRIGGKNEDAAEINGNGNGERATYVKEVQEITPAVVDNARLTLLDILKTMSFNVEVVAKEVKDNVIDLEITGAEDLGLVIGKEGNTLEALQFLLSSMLSKKYGKKVYIRLDANDYKAKQEQVIIAAANDAADVAEKEGVQIVLDPMTASERRLVHMILKERPAIETFSRGDRSRRQVVVSPKGFKKENANVQN